MKQIDIGMTSFSEFPVALKITLIIAFQFCIFTHTTQNAVLYTLGKRTHNKGLAYALSPDFFRLLLRVTCTLSPLDLRALRAA